MQRWRFQPADRGTFAGWANVSAPQCSLSLANGRMPDDTTRERSDRAAAAAPGGVPSPRSEPGAGRARRWPLVVCAVVCALIAAAGWRWWETQRLLGAVPRPGLAGADRRVVEAVEQALQLVRRHPRNAEAWGQAGMVLHAHEYTEEALACYRRAARLAPLEPQWWYLAAMVLRHRDPAEARRLLQGAAEVDPDEPLFRIRLAELEADAGRWDQAERHVDTALRLRPDDPHALWLKARVHIKYGRWADAERVLERAAEILAQHALIAADLRLVRFRLYGTSQDPDEDEPAPQGVVADPIRAPEIGTGTESTRTGVQNGAAVWPDRFLEQLAQYRFDPHWQTYRAAELARFGRLVDAIRTMQQVVACSPEEPLFAATLVRLLVQAGRLSDAEQAVEEARRRHPEDFELLRLAATVRLLRGDAATAATLLQQAIERKPDNAAVRYDRALALLAMNRREEALRELEAAVRADPGFFDAWFALANERAVDGEIEAARGCVQNALRLRPADPRAQRLQQRLEKR